MRAAGATGRALERRRERRIVVHLPIHVRGTDRDGLPFEEATESENVCRGGAAFPIQRELDLGAELEITIPPSRQGSQPENDFSTRGRVVHVAPGRHQLERIVGVQFVGPRFHRVFVSESTA